jgi:hypothetical protein
MVELIRTGLATATTGRVMAGARPIMVARVRITEAGRQVLGRAKPRPQRRRSFVRSHPFNACLYRKSDSAIMVMKSAEDNVPMVCR